MAHAVVAVDQRGRGCALRHRDVRTRIEAAGLEPPHILRQAEHAVRVGAGEIGLGHQFGAFFGVGGRQAGGAERIRDQRPDRPRSASAGTCRKSVPSRLPHSHTDTRRLSTRLERDISRGLRPGAQCGRPEGGLYVDHDRSRSPSRRHRRRRIRRPLGRQGAAPRSLRRHGDRPAQLSPVPAAALSGRDRRPLARRYRLADPRHPARPAKRQRRARQGLGRRCRAPRGAGRRPRAFRSTR